jgi:thiol-disulfide isomerase/thioredoxin
MNVNFLGTLAFLSCISVSFSQSLPLKTGVYDAALRLNQTTSLPVHLSIEKKEKTIFAVIHNAEERIECVLKEKIGDTLIIPFPNFDSELRVVATKKEQLNGFWVNYNKAGNYRIPFTAKRKTSSSKTDQAAVNLSGRWETYFSPSETDKEAAVGIIEQKGNELSGTVLTETGDYRYLQGTVEGSKFYLAAFDGTHAFLLNGTYDGKTLTGNFFSGKHYQTDFKATLNPSFELRHADSLTYLKEQHSRINFQLKDINGGEYSFPNAETEGKVVIIQIMGTWCPNCMDETKYYKELYAKYHTQGLEIISIGYEAAETFDEQAEKIKRLKERHNLDFTFLVGGKANKTLASEQFKMLNEVISFPTSIYIGRDGMVKRIHTGFNGPGTGEYYIEYVEKTNALIESLLAQ